MSALPFLPFARPEIDTQTIAEVSRVLASGWVTSGPKVLAFEEQLRALFGGRPVRTFSNGSATMEIALRVAGIGSAGSADEVITTSISWASTANVIVAVGAKPVFVDIDPQTRNIDLDAVEAAVNARTRAIMPVYLSGLPVDMDRLYAIAKKHGLRVIEDAAQAIDSRWNSARIGSLGDLVSFSFQANKNITCAEGGCLVMNDEAEAELAQRLRLQGVVRDGLDGMDVALPGGKFNLTDINAAIGLGQLAHLPEITLKRAQLAEAYFEAAQDQGLESLGVELPQAKRETGAITNWHMFQVLLPTKRLKNGRASVMQTMKDAGIGTGVHYPAMHLFSFYRSLGWREGMLPVAEHVGRSILTLPLFSFHARKRRPPGLRQSCQRLQGTSPMTARALSVVIPVFNEEDVLQALFDRLYRVLDELHEAYEIVFINDGSSDRSAQILAAQFRKRPDVTRVVQFGGNFGQHMAIMAGFARSRGEIVITLDADLQNPPEEIPRLMSEIRKGHDYVGTVRRTRIDSLFRKVASKTMNWLRERITRIKMSDQGCMLRAYDRSLVETLNACREVNTFIPALAYTFAASPTEIDVAHEERHAGESKYSLYRLLRLNFDLVTGFSIVPLQWFSLVGMLLSVLSGVLFVVLLVRRFMLGSEVEGVFTLFALQFFLTGILLFGIGLMGEYVGRIQQEVRRRPRYRISAVLEASEPDSAESAS